MIDLKSFTQNHTDVEIMEGDEKRKWRFIGFYG